MFAWQRLQRARPRSTYFGDGRPGLSVRARSRRMSCTRSNSSSGTIASCLSAGDVAQVAPDVAAPRSVGVAVAAPERPSLADHDLRHEHGVVAGDAKRRQVFVCHRGVALLAVVAIDGDADHSHVVEEQRTGPWHLVQPPDGQVRRAGAPAAPERWRHLTQLAI